MHAAWDSKDERLTVVGQHRGGTPRRWLVNLWLQHEDGSRTRWQFKPQHKILLTDLAPLIDDEVERATAQSGRAARVGWTAVAR